MPQAFSPLIAGRALWGLLVLNIAEAAIFDALKGNLMNAVAGFLICMAILPRAKDGGVLAKRHGYHLLAVDLPWAWILPYTVWHLCFM